MNGTRLLKGVLVLVFASGVLAADVKDVVGTWKLKYEPGDGQTHEPVLTITEEGTGLNAKFGEGDRKDEVKEITYKDGKLILAVRSEHNGEPVSVIYEANVKGESMEGDARWEYQGMSGSFPFEAKRQAAEPAPGTRGNPDNVPFIGRADPKGNPVRLAKATGHVSNYSEERVRPYTLPHPLIMANGERVASADQWTKSRRSEILNFYREQIYGRVPDNAPQVTWEVAETDSAAREGKALMKRVVGRMGEKPDDPRMNLTVFLPAKADGPVPMLLSISFGFGPRGPAPNKAAAPAKDQDKKADVAKAAAAFDPVGQLLGRGWGYASMNYGDIQPDRADRWTEGVIGLTLRPGQTRPAPDEWGTISAWAWGISRAIDHLQTDTAVDSRRIAITGVSRLGKTVLWAGAQDERVAAVFSVVSGEMGASLIRRDWGETLDDMAQNFPWQFAGNLQKWVGRWDELPVDQHMLIALCAPRPVFVTGGVSDQWSDPKGEFLALEAAGPVYELLGAKGLGVKELPSLDRPVIDGDLGFHYHSGGHTTTPADWKAFLEFAERQFREAKAR
jgi:hypothetical protein